MTWIVVVCTDTETLVAHLPTEPAAREWARRRSGGGADRCRAARLPDGGKAGGWVAVRHDDLRVWQPRRLSDVAGRTDLALYRIKPNLPYGELLYVGGAELQPAGQTNG